LKRWDTEKTVKQSGTFRLLHNFLTWLKVDGEITENLVGLHFWKGLRSAGWSTRMIVFCILYVLIHVLWILRLK